METMLQGTLMQETSINKLEEQLRGWEQGIHHLETNLDRVGPLARSRYFRHIQELKEKRDAARNRLSRLRRRQQSREDQELEAGIVRVFDAIECRVNRLLSEVSEPLDC